MLNRICLLVLLLGASCGLRARLIGAETQLVVASHPVAGPPGQLEPEVLDFRYAPKRWQTCIGLPDDPAKTLVGSDGGIYFAFGKGSSKHFGFGSYLLADLVADGKAEAPRQELHRARVPAIITRSRKGPVELRQVAWASPPAATGAPKRSDFLWLTVSNTGSAPAAARLRVTAESPDPLKLDASRTRLVSEDDAGRLFCTFSRPCEPSVVAKQAAAPERLRIRSVAHHVVRNWASPTPAGCDSFKHIIVGNRNPLVFEFSAEPGERYVAVFGLIEAWHKEPGNRPMELLIENQPVRQIDLIRDSGRNRPVILPFPALDDNGDGKIRLAVRSLPGAPDQSPVVSGIWVFPAASAPAAEALLTGQVPGAALGYVNAEHLPGQVFPTELTWDCGTLAPGQTCELFLSAPQNDEARHSTDLPAAAQAELERAVRFWESAALPYSQVQVPDPAVQDLLDSCIRNLYQAREIKNGHPKFQVGPTCYRGAWAADGAFILETIAYLGRPQEAREGIEAQIDQDDGPGGVEFSKKTGLRLFTLWRHAQLTGDRDWLRTMWPRVEREVKQIMEYRAMTRQEPGTPNCGLMPPGTGDGGLGGPFREYTNVYWTLAGLRAASEAAQWMGESQQVSAWQAEFEDYWAAFDRARQRDKRTDASGNVFVPPVMPGEPEQLPQRGAWAFLQSIYPGRLFAADDALMRGTLGMLDANQREGLIYGTGWIADGIWNYAASFYGHAHLWLGHGRKAAATLYAFGNHASPLLIWREEQNVRGEREKYVGDMPHNWASAEFIRLVRHLLVLERGNELHLLEGLPRRWTQPGAETRLSAIPTTFGAMSLALRFSPDGTSATLELDPPRREAPAKIVIHAEHLGAFAGDRTSAAVPATGRLVLELPLRRP